MKDVDQGGVVFKAVSPMRSPGHLYMSALVARHVFLTPVYVMRMLMCCIKPQGRGMEDINIKCIVKCLACLD